MRLLLPILANLVLLAAALGYGSLLKRLYSRKMSLFDQMALTLVGGLGIVGTLLYGVGHFSFSRPVILGLLAAGLFLFWKLALPFLRNCYAEWKTVQPPVLPALVIVGVLLVTLVGGNVAPTGDMGNDVIAYHLLGPKVWLRNGIIQPVLDQSYTNFPAIVEALYGALMALGGERAPEFFAVTGLMSILLVAAGLAMRLGLNASGAWWCASIVAAMPAVYRGAYGGFIDAVYGAFVLAAAWIGFEAEQTGEYALFGILCGFAIATKYTGLIAVGALICCILVISIFVPLRDYKTTLRGLCVAGGIAVLVGGTVYVRNWILLGCPIYPPPPILPRYFRVRYMSPSAIDGFHRHVLTHGRGMGRSVSSFLLLPFNLTYHTANFNGAGGIGLAPLALAPLGVAKLRWNAFGVGLALVTFLWASGWFFTSQESRYLIPVYVLGAAFAVVGWNYTAAVAPRFGPLLSGFVVACSLLYGLFMVGSARVGDLHAAVSPSYARERAQVETPFLDSLEYLNQNPAVTKVLILEPLFPAFHVDKAYVKPVGGRGEESVPDAGNLEAVLREAPGMNVSHVLDVRWKGGPFQIPDSHAGLTLVFERQGQRIYRVN